LLPNGIGSPEQLKPYKDQPKRRGRPPKNPLAALATPAPAKKKGRRTFTAAQRKAQAAKMKAYWAKRKKEGK
jgi:hypothetical protein